MHRFFVFAPSVAGLVLPAGLADRERRENSSQVARQVFLMRLAFYVLRFGRRRHSFWADLQSHSRQDLTMAYDEKLAARLDTALRARPGFEPRNMFGSVGWFLRGNMCVGTWKDSLVVRCSPA